jgi:3-dehydroquinate dehydratase/shikimate dehydrogenase
LILSSHDFERRPENLDAIVHEMIDAQEAVAKVAYRGAHVVDSFAALDLMHEHGSTVIAVCMGEEGLWTRVLAKKFNAFASFCSLAAEEATAPGQSTLEEMIGSYRWKDIDRSTKVYGVLGDPIAHSMSPFLFNRWFADAGINAVYLPMRVGASSDGLARFLDGCVDRPWLDVAGFSVTLPHKFAARQWVGDGADHQSQWIGAVNTLAFGGERPTGYNTDCYAAITSMCNALRCDRSDVAGLTVDLLGAGGAARAVVEGLREIGCRVTVYGRTQQRTKRFVEECGVTAAAWEDRIKRRGEVLINCTPLGLWPKVNDSPMPADALDGCRLVFDLIYRPLQTQLLYDAATAGCATLNGSDMFVRQAAMQFELWTGRTPDLQQARDLVTRGVQQP